MFLILSDKLFNFLLQQTTLKQFKFKFLFLSSAKNNSLMNH